MRKQSECGGRDVIKWGEEDMESEKEMALRPREGEQEEPSSGSKRA